MDPGSRRRRRMRAGGCESGRPRLWRSQADVGPTGVARQVAAAISATIVDDLRDPDGLTRPMLRRAAQWIAVNGREAIHRLGPARVRQDAGRAALPPGLHPAPRLLSAGKPAEMEGADQTDHVETEI